MTSFLVGYRETKQRKIWFFPEGSYNLHSATEKGMYKSHIVTTTGETCELSWVIQRGLWFILGNSQRIGTHESFFFHMNMNFLGERMDKFVCWPIRTMCACVSVCFSLLMLLLPLLSPFSRVRLCVTQEMTAHQALPSLGSSRQEYWSGLPFPFPMHESEKSKWSHSVVSDSLRPHGLQPTRLLRPWDFPGQSTGVGCHCLLHYLLVSVCKCAWLSVYLGEMCGSMHMYECIWV